MFVIALLMALAVAGAALMFCLVVVAGLLKLTLRVALFPLFLSVGLVKLLVLPILGLAALIVLFTVGPVVLAVVAIAAIPLAALAALCGLAWGGLRLITVI